MAEPERKCATCKFYEPAPIWRKGWCRNPLLYAPQQSHLVAEDDLDCSRGLSDYWEAADGTGPNAGVNIAASSGSRDFFGRGNTGSADNSAADASDNPWSMGSYGSNDSYGGSSGGSGYHSGYSSVGRAIPPVEDDGYAPQEPTSSRPGAQPRYLGSVGDEDDANDVRNPWDTSQRGYATPPTQSGESDRYGSGTGYGRTGHDASEQEPRGGYGNERGYEDERERGYGAESDRGHGQASGYGASGYGSSGYGTPDADNGYDQTPYSQNGYAQGGYGAESDRGGYQGYGQGQEYGAQGGYGQGGYGQGGYGTEPGGYGQGAYGDQGGYGQNGAYDSGGYGAPTSPPPAVSGTRAPAAGAASGRRVTAAPQGRERALTYYTEERYWTDYAKLAVPVVVVIALLGAIWFIGTGKIGRGTSATSTPNSATIAAGGTSPTGAAGARGTGPATAGSPGAGTPRASGAAGTVGAVTMGTPPPILPSVVVPTANGSMTSPATTGTMPAAGMPVMSVQFKVANTGGSGANMRADASTSAAVVTVVPEGSLVQQVGSPMMAADGLWYKVQFGDKTGWIRNDFLVAA